MSKINWCGNGSFVQVVTWPVVTLEPHLNCILISEMLRCGETVCTLDLIKHSCFFKHH